MIQIRHPIQTLFEVAVPIAVIALVVVIRGLVSVSETPEDTRYTAINGSLIGVSNLDGFRNRLAYSPENVLLERLVRGVQEEFGFDDVDAFHNASLLEANGLNELPFASFEFDENLRVS